MADRIDRVFSASLMPPRSLIAAARLRVLVAIALGAWLAAGLAGCQTTGGEPAAAPPPGDADVVAVYAFYPSDPWLRNTDQRIIGLQARAYFTSRETDRGRFVPGEIIADLILLAGRPDGGFDRFRLHRWELREEEARGFRIRKMSTMGDSYGLVLSWPNDMNLMGQRVELQIAYRRTDGRLLKSPARQITVPLPVTHAGARPEALRQYIERGRAITPLEERP